MFAAIEEPQCPKEGRDEQGRQMFHRDCLTWIRRYPFGACAIGGLILALWPIAYILFIEGTHQLIREGGDSGGIAVVVEVQHDCVVGNLIPVVPFCLVVGVPIAFCCGICEVLATLVVRELDRHE